MTENKPSYSTTSIASPAEVADAARSLQPEAWRAGVAVGTRLRTVRAAAWLFAALLSVGSTFAALWLAAFDIIPLGFVPAFFAMDALLYAGRPR